MLGCWAWSLEQEFQLSSANAAQKIGKLFSTGESYKAKTQHLQDLI